MDEERREGKGRGGQGRGLASKRGLGCNPEGAGPTRCAPSASFAFRIPEEPDR
jgi:hypothetical protein